MFIKRKDANSNGRSEPFSPKISKNLALIVIVLDSERISSLENNEFAFVSPIYPLKTSDNVPGDPNPMHINVRLKRGLGVMLKPGSINNDL